MIYQTKKLRISKRGTTLNYNARLLLLINKIALILLHDYKNSNTMSSLMRNVVKQTALLFVDKLS